MSALILAVSVAAYISHFTFFVPLKCFVYDYLNKRLLFVTFPRFMELIIEQHVR